MQAHFTQFGRVELDPLRIPTVGQSSGRDEAFARQLESAIRQRTAARAPAPPADQVEGDEAGADETAVAAATAPAPHVAPPERANAASPGTVVVPANLAQDTQPVAALDQETRPLAPANPDRAAGASAAGELAPPPPVAAPAIATAPITAATSVRFVPQAAAPLVASATTTPARSAGGGISLATEARADRATITTSAAGYRSLDSLAIDRMEAARDSVLRQIVFTLQNGTSEARMQLDPPELGALDLQVIVDASGQTRLSLVAERPEVAALLTQHMPALASTLAQQGLAITHAEVTSRDGRPRGELFASPSPRGRLRSGEALDTDSRPPVTFIQSAGLDFWV